MKRLVVFCAVMVLLFGGLSATSWAAVQVGNFHITFDPTLPDPSGDPNVDDGWENPTTGERWFFYPNIDNPEEGPFWNQWWYDDPPDWNRWKEIFYDLTIEPHPLVPGQPPAAGTYDTVKVALNWSNMEYPETGPIGPPPGPDDEYAIEREVIFEGPVFTGETVQIENLLNGPFVIPDYNPEWVSIDVWVDYADSTNPADNVIEIFGMIQHECVPEPSVIVMLCMGAFGLLLARRRSK